MQHWYVIYPFDVALNAAYVYHTDRVYQISLYMLNLNERRVTKIISGIHESRTLAELRDTLLPKLMSGAVRVPEAAEMAGV
jgi:hypothetical protein